MKLIRFLALATTLFLAGCVTYPYQTAFGFCDDEAGACYEYCEQFADEPGEYQACHAECEVGANQCFADAYDTNTYSASPYASSYDSWPWTGRYGSWGPRRGYYFDFTYYNSYSRFSRPRYGRSGYGRPYREQRPRAGNRGDRNEGRSRGEGRRGDRPRGDGSGQRRDQRRTDQGDQGSGVTPRNNRRPRSGTPPNAGNDRGRAEPPAQSERQRRNQRRRPPASNDSSPGSDSNSGPDFTATPGEPN